MSSDIKEAAKMGSLFFALYSEKKLFLCKKCKNCIFNDLQDTWEMVE